jgi:hypothetical protein
MVMPRPFNHISPFGDSADYAGESWTVEVLRISDPHVGVKPQFRLGAGYTGVYAGYTGVYMEWLARIALVREEEKPNTIRTEDDRHVMGRRVGELIRTLKCKTGINSSIDRSETSLPGRRPNTCQAGMPFSVSTATRLGINLPLVPLALVRIEEPHTAGLDKVG